MKDPAQSDANGQNVVESSDHLLALLKNYSPQDLKQRGLVLEANVFHPRALSVGQIILDSRVFSYFGEQFSSFHDGKEKYGGTVLTMMRGPLAELASNIESPQVKQAVEQANSIYQAYSLFDPIISRANFDVVQGTAQNGHFLSGVTDQSLRLGGASPAEVLAISHLSSNIEHNEVTAEVKLQYDPSEEDRSGVLFLDHPTLTIQAKIISYT